MAASAPRLGDTREALIDKSYWTRGLDHLGSGLNGRNATVVGICNHCRDSVIICIGYGADKKNYTVKLGNLDLPEQLAYAA